MFYFCCSLTCLVFTLGFMGGKKFIRLLSLIICCSHASAISVHIAVSFPSLLLLPAHPKVALCAAGHTYASCMKPQGQPRVCKSVWHSKT